MQLPESITSRPKYRKRGLIMTAISVAILLNSGSRFPFPITGIPSVALSLLMMLYGLRFLYRGLRLPVIEVLDYLNYKNGRASIKELNLYFDYEADCLEQTIEVLRSKNWVLAQNEVLEEVESKNLIDESLLILQSEGLKELKRVKDEA